MVPVASVPESVALAFRSNASPLFVACSGGADSVCALLLVCGYRERSALTREIACIHFDHRLRGEESATDAAFVSELCGALGVELRGGVARWNVEPKEVTEEMAREARLDFFAEVASSFGCSDLADIVTGHHADDVAESMLMRLSRGSGLQGLTAPRPVSLGRPGLRFLRPLLGLARTRIRELLEQVEVSWREDSSNATDAYYRNRLRRQVLPAWDAASDRPVLPGVARSRALLEEDWEALEQWTAELWERAWRGDGLDLAVLGGFPRGVQRRLLQRLCQDGGGSVLAAGAMDGVLTDLGQGRSFAVEIGPSVRLVGRDGLARLERGEFEEVAVDWEDFRLPIGCVAYLPDGARLGARMAAVDAEGLARLGTGEADDGRWAMVLPGEKHCHSLWVRRRQPGDAFKPHGKSSPKKLKDLFIERKVPARERGHRPLFCLEGREVLWVPGLPPSGDHALVAPTPNALRLTYER